MIVLISKYEIKVMSSRNLYLDNTKALLIILVVFGHFIEQILSYYSDT